MPLEDIREARREKLKRLKDAGIDPYPGETLRTHTIGDAIKQFKRLQDEKKGVVLCGRIMARREHGKCIFLDIRDGSGVIQGYIRSDGVGEESYTLICETIDIGDIVEFYGTLFETKRSEKSIDVIRWRILTKTFMPLPEKWHGLQDVEERFRKRYLDLLFNDDVKDKFLVRAKIIRAMRMFMEKHDFLEVMTPTLQTLYGGASARPFKTHLHALDMDVYLRIAPELYLKRLLVGGLDAVYEFTTNFRNEGIDRDHNPEFSGMEFYAAYKDHTWAMAFTEEMLESVLEDVIGSTTITYQGNPIHFKRPYVRVTFSELLHQYAGVNYDNSSEDDMRASATKLGVTIEKIVGKAGLADEIFKKTIRSKLIEPTFVTEYPEELLPLAKRVPEKQNYVSAFQFYAGGLELIKAFTELNDPIDQRARFSSQEAKRAKGDEEAQRMDEDFIEALEYGMPPAAGWGIGIDRFVALLTDSHSIREVILFPLMKQK